MLKWDRENRFYYQNAMVEFLKYYTLPRQPSDQTFGSWHHTTNTLNLAQGLVNYVKHNTP